MILKLVLILKHCAILFLAVGFSCATFAATESLTTPNGPPDRIDTVEEHVDSTKNLRGQKDYFFLLNYSPMDLLIPSKWGATIGLIGNIDKTQEIEYLHGGLSVPFVVRDLGSMSDDRVSFIQRSYFGGNSFNVSYGITYFDFSIHLGDKLLGSVNRAYPSIDVLKIQSLGANLAIGQRWSVQWPGKGLKKTDITFGVDYFSWAQPLYVLNKDSAFLDRSSNQDDKDSVRDAMNIIAYFPRFALIKVQLGLQF